MNGTYTLAQISTCADIIRDSRPHEPTPEEKMCRTLAGTITENTGPWHYIDIPVPKFEKSLAPYCPQGNCVVAALKKFSEALRHPQDEAQRRAALLFIVHFAGDIHQPLHCAERACDHGGNSERVNFFQGKKELSNEGLHKVWDTDMIDQAMMDAQVTDEQVFASQLASQIDPDQARRWAGTSIDDIAWESHAIAAKRVYRGIPFENFCDDHSPARTTSLSTRYERVGARIVREQLMKAGVRLAAMLESDLGSAETPVR